MRTHAGHWADSHTKFADLGAGVSHRQAEAPFTFPESDAEDFAHPVRLGRVLAAYLVLMVVIVMLVRYFLKA